MVNRIVLQVFLFSGVLQKGCRFFMLCDEACPWNIAFGGIRGGTDAKNPFWSGGTDAVQLVGTDLAAALSRGSPTARKSSFLSVTPLDRVSGGSQDCSVDERIPNRPRWFPDDSLGGSRVAGSDDVRDSCHQPDDCRRAPSAWHQ